MHQVYILFSEKLNRFYTGFTSNLEERLAFHKGAENRKFTYNASDWVLFFTINCESKPQGLAIEKHIKSMKSKTYIENLPNLLKCLKN
jgi:putative endonuclease